MTKKTLLFSFAVLLALSISNPIMAQQAPQFKTSKEKEQWVKTQDSLRLAKKQALLKKNDAGKTTVTGTPREPVKTQLVNEPGFPPYISTGNKTKDDADYAEAKKKWILENPERYKQMTGKKK